MENYSPRFKLRLGLFVAGGIALLFLAIFIIGRQQNLFNPVFGITTNFRSVSGLQVGNNVRFSGITVGTVDNIRIINDSTVQVEMMIKKDVQQFIKNDCKVAIGSEGIIGDRVMIITQGGDNSPIAVNGQQLLSTEPIETDAIMASLQVTADNAAVASEQLAGILTKINSGNGTLGRLIQDSTIAENIDQTIENLEKSSKGLEENMNAAKENFLLKGYFNKKKKEAEKRKREQEEQNNKKDREKEKNSKDNDE